LLAKKISTLSPEHQERLMVYGGGKAIEALQEDVPHLTVLATNAAKRCLINYALLGWTTTVPQECRKTLFMVPTNVAPFAWGYPDRLIDRLAAYDTIVVLLGDYDGSGFSSGIDDAETYEKVPEWFDGAIWTNRIDRIGPLAARDS
jgi:glycerophosphoryl diester phosphodiesterase